MYVVTFYSFKGGVGRSMSLVNVGMELAKKGHKVLLVDFDLEAPGLSTFECLSPPKTYKGIVEFVNDYKATYAAPDVLQYIYNVKTPPKIKGEVYVMPAGTIDEKYGEKLNSINWSDLYENADGFLLFEDLKKQWEKSLSPDYVLIDSRTGYTDVAGICTRQLPNAVCLLFFPNDQNLIGIERIVSDIRTSSVSKQPVIHFVMSNVPDIDDEDQILANRMAKFESKLKYKNSTTIHHYANLALLNQSIFTIDRPNSRLAKEYRQLSGEIRSQNPADRESALDFLRSAAGSYGEIKNNIEREKFLDQVTRIEQAHINDSEIDYYLARFKQTTGDLDESLALLNRSIENGSTYGAAYVNRSFIMASLGELDNALETLVQAFSNHKLVFTYLDIVRGLKISLRSENLATTKKLIASPAVRSLEPGDKIQVAYDLLESLSGTVLAEELIRESLPSTKNKDHRSWLEFYLIFCLIAQGKLGEAHQLMETREPNSTASDNYNKAMVAYWLGNKESAISLFKHVLQQDLEGPIENANILQCFSFACWVIGNTEEALAYLDRARRQSSSENRIFSCWRYYKVLTNVFNDDLNEMKQLYLGKNVQPVFLQNNKLT